MQGNTELSTRCNTLLKEHKKEHLAVNETYYNEINNHTKKTRKTWTIINKKLGREISNYSQLQ